jgi:hypothetical protein
VTDSRGVLQSRAPRWFLEATGWIQARGRYTPYPRKTMGEVSNAG